MFFMYDGAPTGAAGDGSASAGDSYAVTPRPTSLMRLWTLQSVPLG
jgi:hypothetical protein